MYIIFKDKKSKKKSQSNSNQGFSSFFCMVIGSYGIPYILACRLQIYPDPDPAYHFLQIRIQLFTLMRIRILPFNLMLIRIHNIGWNLPNEGASTGLLTLFAIAPSVPT